MDTFFKDYRNRQLEIVWAIEYVRDEMAGKKTAGQLLDELNDWRKIVAPQK
jgi:hypothetical protein